MADEILRKTIARWSFQSSVYVPTGNSDLADGTPTPTVVDLTLDEGGTGLAAGAAINSDQIDIDVAGVRPNELHFKAAIEFFAAIVVGEGLNFYWSGSGNSAVAAGNAGNPDGVDGLYTGDGGGTVAESVPQMIFIGFFRCTDLQGVQIADIGTITPLQRYGQLIVVNDTATIVCGTDDIESSVLMTGNAFQSQAA